MATATKQLTPRQKREREKAWLEAEEVARLAANPGHASMHMTASERVDWLRQRAGWPALRRT